MPSNDLENPFCVPGRTFEEPGPLVPWQEVTHAEYYAVVNHTQEAYEDFLSKAKGWNICGSGATVMVYGEDGCGKTSLIHRCANAIKSGSAAVQIVDRSREQLGGHTALTKCDEVVRAVLRHLRKTSGFIANKDLDSLPVLPAKTDESDLRAAMEEVSDALKASDRKLIVIPSRFEVIDEVKTYVAVLARACIVLFLETSHDNNKFVERWNLEPSNRKMLGLRVGPLEIDHGWVFVRSRIKEKLQKPSTPVFDQNAVAKYMQTRSEHGVVSVRELERVCLRLFEDALRNSKERIEYDDFANLWVRRGSILS